MGREFWVRFFIDVESFVFIGEDVVVGREIESIIFFVRAFG